jgi:hypothetical protein
MSETLDPRVGSAADAGMDQLEHFRRFKVIPPSALYITVDDIFQVNVWVGSSVQTVVVSARILTPAGEIQRLVQQYSSEPVAPAGQNLHVIQGMEGFLLSLEVDAGSSNVNTCFVRVVLQKGQGSSDIQTGLLLCQGYVSQYDSICFPTSVPQRSLDGRGGNVNFTVANPAAGADWTTTVTNGLMWKPVSISALFTASGAAANRFPVLEFADITAKIFFAVPVNAAIIAGQAIQCSWYPGANPVNVNNFQTMALPIDGRVGANMRIKTVTTAIDAGDAWTNIRMLLEQWVGI